MPKPPAIAATAVVLPTMWSGPWIWREQQALLAAAAETVVELPDAIVQWDSGPTLEDLDAFVAARLDAWSPPFLLVGCSLGGLLALRAAVRRPEAVRAVVASGCPGLGHGGRLFDAPRAALTLEDARQIRSRLFNDTSVIDDEALMEAVEAVAGRREIRRAVPILRELGRYDAPADLAPLAVPAALLWGADDRIAPGAPWRELAASSSYVTYREVSPAGHVPMLEAPAPFNAMLTDWLAAEAKPSS